MICFSVRENMICFSVREKRRCVIRIYIFLMVEMFYSFERCFTLFDLPFYSFTSVGVNRSGLLFSGYHLLLSLLILVFFQLVYLRVSVPGILKIIGENGLGIGTSQKRLPVVKGIEAAGSACMIIRKCR